MSASRWRRVAAAGQVTLVHRDVGDRLQGDGDRAQVVGSDRPLGELEAVGQPPGVGGRVGHRRPDVRGHGVVRIDDERQPARPIGRLGPQRRVGVELHGGREPGRQAGFV